MVCEGVLRARARVRMRTAEAHGRGRGRADGLEARHQLCKSLKPVRVCVCVCVYVCGAAWTKWTTTWMKKTSKSTRRARR
jgi:hypothetical protein